MLCGNMGTELDVRRLRARPVRGASSQGTMAAQTAEQVCDTVRLRVNGQDHRSRCDFNVLSVKSSWSMQASMVVCPRVRCALVGPWSCTVQSCCLKKIWHHQLSSA